MLINMKRKGEFLFMKRREAFILVPMDEWLLMFPMDKQEFAKKETFYVVQFGVINEITSRIDHWCMGRVYKQNDIIPLVLPLAC